MVDIGNFTSASFENFDIDLVQNEVGGGTVSIDQIEGMVDAIETQLQQSLDREVTSMAIGELTMEQLKNVDEVAYVRFASVYRQFKDINTFMEELNKLLKEK